MAGDALLDALAARLAAAPAIRVEHRDAGIEALHVDEAGETARPRILFFREKDRVVAFFYKPSRLDFSRDRFAYGAIFLYGATLDDEASAALDAAVAFLVSGFHPDSRPARLKRSLTFTVPEVR